MFAGLMLLQFLAHFCYLLVRFDIASPCYRGEPVHGSFERAVAVTISSRLCSFLFLVLPLAFSYISDQLNCDAFSPLPFLIQHFPFL